MFQMNRSGAQGLGKEDRIFNKPDNEDLIELKARELHNQSEINKLKADLRVLAEINGKLNKLVRENEVKLGLFPVDLDSIRTEYGEEISRLPSNLHEFEFILPLLETYETKVATLDVLLVRAVEDIAEAERKSERIVDDNKLLREQLEKKCQTILDIYKTGHIEETVGVMFNKLEKEELNERMRILNEENNFLANSLKELNHKFSTIQRHYTESSDENDTLVGRYQELSKQNKQLELDYEELRKEKVIIDQKFKKIIDDNNKMEIERDEMLNVLSRYENDIKVYKTQLNTSRRNVNEIEDQKETEMILIMKENDLLKAKDRDLSNKMVFLERDLDSCRDDNRRYKKEVESAKADCDQMLKMIEALQSKISNYEKREDTMNRISRDSKEKLEEALILRDRAMLKEEQYQKALENINEEHRREVQLIKEQYDRLLDGVRTKNKNALESRENEMKNIIDENAKLVHHNERLSKEAKALKNEVQKLSQIIKETSNQKDDKFDEYEKHLVELEDKLINAENEYNTNLRIIENQKSLLETQNKQIQSETNELKREIETLRIQNSNVTSEIDNVRSKWNASHKERQNFFDELSKMKKTYEAQMQLFADNYNEKLREMEDEVHEWQKKEQTTKEKSLDLLKNHEWIEEKLKRELESNIRYYEKIIIDLKNENRYLTQRLKDNPK
jgi:chromosome segregation ATPase